MNNKGNVLKSNSYLGTNEYLVSRNGAFFALMQSDGNLCVYRGDGPANNHGLLWDSHSKRDGGAFFAIVQPDANFCIYKGTDPKAGGTSHVWSISTKSRAIDDYHVVMQDDGNLCMYRGKGDAAGTATDFVWQTGVTDPWKDFELQTITYNPGQAKITGVWDKEVSDWKTVRVDQSNAWVKLEVSVTDKMDWQDKYLFKENRETELTTQVPVLGANQKVVMEPVLEKKFTWNGGTTRVASYNGTIQTLTNFPPETTPKTPFRIKASWVSFDVPYSITGIHSLSSGKKFPVTLGGVYHGYFMRNMYAELRVIDDVNKWEHVYREEISITPKPE